MRDTDGRRWDRRRGTALLRAPFVAPAKAGAHPWLPMPPQPAESGPNRLRLLRKPRLDPGSEAGVTGEGTERGAARIQMCVSGRLASEDGKKSERTMTKHDISGGAHDET